MKHLPKKMAIWKHNKEMSFSVNVVSENYFSEMHQIMAEQANELRRMYFCVYRILGLTE